MDSCCDSKADELAQLRTKQGRVLYFVLAINAIMFFVEFTAGWIVNSTALLADSLDMLGDTLVYTISLYVLHRGVRARAGAALFKSGFLMFFGLLIIGEAIRKSVLGVVPEAGWMGVIGLIALAANLTCLMLLYRHRSDDINMSSTWLCSRNDVIANTSVLAAAALVAFTGTLWPDVILGVGLALLYLHSSWQVAREAWPQWRGHSPREVQALNDAPTTAPDACCESETAAKPASGCSSSEPVKTASCCGGDTKAQQSSCCGTRPSAKADACCGSDAEDLTAKN
jgi:Co/Zn/Cd efflux system component